MGKWPQITYDYVNYVWKLMNETEIGNCFYHNGIILLIINEKRRSVYPSAAALQRSLRSDFSQKQ